MNLSHLKARSPVRRKKPVSRENSETPLFRLHKPPKLDQSLLDLARMKTEFRAENGAGYWISSPSGLPLYIPLGWWTESGVAVVQDILLEDLKIRKELKLA